MEECLEDDSGLKQEEDVVIETQWYLQLQEEPSVEEGVTANLQPPGRRPEITHPDPDLLPSDLLLVTPLSQLIWKLKAEELS